MSNASTAQKPTLDPERLKFFEAAKLVHGSHNIAAEGVGCALNHANRLLDGIEAGEMLVGSRTRWITPAADNFGFAAWAEAHRAELLALGPGSHFGEWWGSGIQRGYDFKGGERFFSLFNVSRWAPEGATMRPACCGVVPVLWRGLLDYFEPDHCINGLIVNGSQAAPGFMKPEGIVVHHVAGCVSFKKTIERDEEPKGLVRR